MNSNNAFASTLFSQRLGDDLLQSSLFAQFQSSLFSGNASALSSRATGSALLIPEIDTERKEISEAAISWIDEIWQHRLGDRVASAFTPIINSPTLEGSATAVIDEVTGAFSGVNVSATSNPASTSRRDLGGDTLRTAGNMGWLNGAISVDEFVGSTDSLDFYQFRVAQDSEVHLSLTGLEADANLFLIDDRNQNGRVDIEQGEVINWSDLSGRAAERISMGVVAGEYFVAVEQGSGNTSYSLNVGTAAFGRSQTRAGTLAADRFVLNPAATRTVISGNGNVDFGQGRYDWIDARSITSANVQSLNLAGVNGAGIAYDDGTGTRIFDAMTLKTGQQILFEGIDTIQLADVALPLDVLTVQPDDPGFEEQWNLHMMGVHNAWRFTQGAEEIAIGIQDSGLGVNSMRQFHPDLSNTTFILGGNTEDDFLRSYTSHGTAVQGIIAAQANNGIGISGINWDSDVINLDTLDGNDSDLNQSSAAQELINFANERNQKLIINMSLGVPGSFGQNFDSAFEAVVAQNPNTLFVISAGNSGQMGISGISSPAVLAEEYDNVIAVGASWGRIDQYGREVTPGERINYPTQWGSQYGEGLTIMGPSEVLSTMAVNTTSGVQFDYHARVGDPRALDSRFSGTSAAAPNVAGVASLVWSANSSLTAGQIKQVLSDTAYRNLPGYHPALYGSGMVNADAAVRRAVAMA